MARVSPLLLDERGVVYVEFLLSFFPVFLLFLSICQLSLLTSAEIVVGQAASQGARSAVVILEDAPEHFDDAPRGDLSQGTSDPEASIEALLSKLGRKQGDAPPEPPDRPQHGARMTPIRTAAYAPLLALAPHDRAWIEGGSVRDGVTSGFVESLGFALRYTRAASAISVHDAPESERLVREPVGPGRAITLRVSYLFQCSIPLVRAVLCKSLSDLLPAHEEEGLLAQSEAPGELARLAPESARFVALVSETTLPLQSAGYTGRYE